MTYPKKSGVEVFSIAYVITESPSEALMQEQLLLDYLFKNNLPCYNITPIAGGGKVLKDYSNHAKNIMASNLGHCFSGRRRTVNGYYVILML